MPVAVVEDVQRGFRITPVPLAPAEVRGALNLRGRIVLAIDMRLYLGLPPAQTPLSATMGIVVKYRDESFSLIVDTVGEVVSLPVHEIETPPANLSGRWGDIAAGVYKNEKELMVIIDLSKIILFGEIV